MLNSLIFGILQGLTEWLPVSSEGVVAAAAAFLLSTSLEEAVALALWLHLGTAIAAMLAFRKDLLLVAGEVLHLRGRPSTFLAFLLTGTLVSGAVGFPLLLALSELSNRVGALAMALVGVLMLVTGALQLQRPVTRARTQSELSLLDGVIVGVAQGVAALPGLSRSGLTVAALLARGVDRADALKLSFILSIPASVGAALFVGIDSGLLVNRDGLIGAATAAVVGLASIHALLAVARRINFAWFVFAIGALIIVSAVVTALPG